MNIDSFPRLPAKIAKKKNDNFARRALLSPADYEGVLKPFLESNYQVIKLSDVFGSDEYHGCRTLNIRHDVDHDYETALRIAEWEAAHGIVSTYCVLHTSWYYGQLFDGEYGHYREFVDLCISLQEMGHEINLHNNFVTLGLTVEGLDVERLLAGELEKLRAYGLNIQGTSAHGDALCRNLRFINHELFAERTWESKGGPRLIEGPEGKVALGSIDAQSYGLIYEAYDYPRDIQVSDSGGRPRLIRTTRGRGGLRRAELAAVGIETPFPSYCCVLTHPIWWDFTARSVQVTRGLFEKAYTQAGFSTEVLVGPTPHEPSPVVRLKWPAGGEGAVLTSPREYGSLMDEILYRAPVYVSRQHVKRMRVSAEELVSFTKRRQDYVSNNEESYQKALLEEIVFLQPRGELLVESASLNVAVLGEQERWEDLAYIAVALAIAFDSLGLPDLATQIKGIGQLVLRRSLEKIVSDDVLLALFSNAFLYPRVMEAVSETGIADRLRSSLHDRLNRSLPTGIKARHALGAALLRLDLSKDENASVEAGGALLRQFGSSRFQESDMHVSDSVPTALFLFNALHTGQPSHRDDVRRMADRFAAVVFDHESGWNSFIGPRRQRLADAPERNGGFSPLLAWWGPSAVSPRLREKLREVAVQPAFGDWFRRPPALIGYAQRLVAD